PSFNAPYRAFGRSEIGVVLSFTNGGGTAFEGAYRVSSGKFDLGFRGGIFTPGGNLNSQLLLGVEARERVVTHTEDFPLDGALILGVGGQFASGNSALIVPIGLSLGRRVDPRDSKISIVPYVQPTGFLIAGSGTTSHFKFDLGLGADFRLTPRFSGRGCPSGIIRREARASRSTETWASPTPTAARARRTARAPRSALPTSVSRPVCRTGSRTDTAVARRPWAGRHSSR